MRTLSVWLLTFLLFSNFLYAAELASPGTAERKLQRGFLNIALSPIDISHELSKEKRKDSFPPSWFAGLGRGGAFAFGRALAGVYEVVTFPLPLPGNYEPVVEPEFVWEHLPADSSKGKVQNAK